MKPATFFFFFFEKMKNTSKIHQIASFCSIRALKNIHTKAATLVVDYQFKQCDVGEYFGLSKFQMSRAVKALKEKRTPGMNGKPPALLPEKELELLKWVEERDSQRNSVSISELPNKVIFLVY